MTTINISALPVPHLELRWSKAKAEGQDSWINRVCPYGLVMPLQKHDIRRESWKTDDIFSEGDDV